MSPDDRMYPEAPVDVTSAPAQPWMDPATPTTSVVITSYNYGHFLRQCIDSVLNQTRPADQIIVVDDGSTDTSRDILSEYADRMEIILRENAGQAAAFNDGFARTTGDIVLFLDADDLLHPEAVRTVLAHWNPDLALMSFGLEMIDADGRSTGAHPFSLNADDGDNRPRLLRSGSVSGPFAFAPTSGNAFSRRFLDTCMPMNEPRWRICADAYLVRAAALYGPIGAVRRVLGCYRIHGGNNYSRTDTFDAWSMRRGFRDMDISARALETLASDPSPLNTDPDGAAIRLTLLMRSVEIRANMAVWSRDFRPFTAAIRSAINTILRGRSPLRQKLAASAGLARYAAAVRMIPRADPAFEEGAGPVRCQPDFLFGRSARETMARLQRPRFTETLPYDTPCYFDRRGIHKNMLADGWSASTLDGCCASLGPVAALEFDLEPGPGPVAFELGIGARENGTACGFRFTVKSGGGTLWTGTGETCADIRFALDRDAWDIRQHVRLEIECTPTGLTWRQKLPPRKPPTFNLWKLHATTRAADETWPLIRPGNPPRLADVIRADPASQGWEIDTDGTALMGETDAHLRLTTPPGPRRFDLELTVADTSRTDWLQISCGDQNLFTGRVGAGGSVRLPLPHMPDGITARFELLLSVSGSGHEADGTFGFSGIGLIEKSADSLSEPEKHLVGFAAPRLVPGQVLHLSDNLTAPRFFRSGWDDIDTAGIRNSDAEAALEFSTPPGITDPILRLELRPVLPPPKNRRHVLGVSMDGEMLKTAELLGTGEITVPLPPAAEAYTLTFHSILTQTNGADDSAITPAVFELTSLGLEGTVPHRPKTPASAPAVSASGPPSLLHLLETATRLAATDLHARPDEVLSLRARLSAQIWQADLRILEGIAVRPDGPAILDRIGAAVAAAPLSDAERTLTTEMNTLWQDDPGPQNALRILLTSLLLLPAFRCPVTPGLTRLPALLLRQPEVIAKWLGREPEFTDATGSDTYIRYLESLLEEIDHILVSERPGSALHGFASETLTNLHNTKALFGPGNLRRQISLRSRCIERLLIQSGATLGRARTKRPNARTLRIGVFVRNLSPSPEAWSVKGMYRGLDRTRFEPVLILQNTPPDAIDTGDVFPRTLSLEGKSVEQAVAAIRALDLDILMLGAYVANWETVTSIVAHRLARLQINSCFNCPTTLGFESFDHAIAWQGTEGPHTQAQYTERMTWISEPLQCAFDFGDVPSTPGDPRPVTRRGFGLKDDDVAFVSGAMIHKIRPELMTAWARILAGAPNSRLILYPFAKFWAMSCAPELFRQAFDAELSRHGVSPDRVITLPQQTPTEVRRILAACDIYLDSFPYSGATTVCEAYSCGCTVVAHSGEMLRQQTGAAWVRVYETPELVASSADEYVRTAIRLANDSAFRAEMSARVQAVQNATQPPYADFDRFGAALSDTLWHLGKSSGLFPGLGSPAVEQPVPANWPEFRSAPPPVKKAQPYGDASQRRQRIAILGLARTGSTLLCDIVARARNSLIDYELFHHEEIQFRGGVIYNPRVLDRRNADPVPWLEDHTATCFDLGYSLVGFKLFPHHDPRVIDHVFSDDYRFVMVTRENMLAQYSSFRLAERTGQWVRHHSDETRSDRLEFDPDDFEKFEKSMLRYRDSFLNLLTDRGLTSLIIEYTSLPHPGTCARLSEFLRHEIPGTRKTGILKQNASRIADRFTNPGDLHDYLTSRNLTRWAEDEMASAEECPA